MDIFRLTNPNDPFKMEQGEIINGIDSKMWVERYLEAGEFELTAKLGSRIQDKLPRGSFISHTNTTEIMLVENHEITGSESGDSEVRITGRGLETFLDHRIVGSNIGFPTTGGLVDYNLPLNDLHLQAAKLVTDHIFPGSLIDDKNVVGFLEIWAIVEGEVTREARQVKPGGLYSRLIEILEVDKLGLKVIRPVSWAPAFTRGNTIIMIHRGADRTKEVIFSDQTGDIDPPDYLLSDRNNKNCAFVHGRWVSVMVDDAEASGFDRRMMTVDASDIDQSFESPPSGTNRSTIVEKMLARGREELAKQTGVSLVNITPTGLEKKYIFRRDYEVGDLITVVGDYNGSSTQRVVEHVEIEDSTGANSSPTLAEP